MRRVFLISPYAGTFELNIDYLRRVMLDCLQRGEAPFAPHGLYIVEALGIAAGRAFIPFCHAAVCYVDRGISSGMRGDLAAFIDTHVSRRPVEYRSIEGPPPSEAWARANDLPVVWESSC
jgi:hypothetical protein